MGLPLTQFFGGGSVKISFGHGRKEARGKRQEARSKR